MDNRYIYYTNIANQFEECFILGKIINPDDESVEQIMAITDTYLNVTHGIAQTLDDPETFEIVTRNASTDQENDPSFEDLIILKDNLSIHYSDTLYSVCEEFPA